MGLMDRAKAAALVVKAKALLKKELPKVEPRGQKWAKLIKEAQAKKDSKAVTLAKKAKDVAEDYAMALQDMERLVDKVKLATDNSDKIKEFVKGMAKADEKANASYADYKDAKKNALKLFEKTKESWDDKVLNWVMDDSPGWNTMKKVFTDLANIKIG
jgi:hypothetical protein